MVDDIWDMGRLKDNSQKCGVGVEKLTSWMAACFFDGLMAMKSRSATSSEWSRASSKAPTLGKFARKETFRGDFLVGDERRWALPLEALRMLGAGKRPVLALLEGLMGLAMLDSSSFSIRCSSCAMLCSDRILSSELSSVLALVSAFGDEYAGIGSESRFKPLRRSSRLMVSPLSVIRFRQPFMRLMASRQRVSILSQPSRRRMISSSRSSTSSRGTKEGLVRRLRRCSRTSSKFMASSLYDGIMLESIFGSLNAAPSFDEISGCSGSPCRLRNVASVVRTRMISASFSLLRS